MLQFVDEDGDWVELVVLICFHGGRSVSGDEEGGWVGDRPWKGRDVEAWIVAMSSGRMCFCLPLASYELVIVGVGQLERSVVLTYLLLARKAKRGSKHQRGQRLWGLRAVWD